jgi:hypothetical protein
VRALAKATAKAGESAQKVWRVARVASKLSAAEIRSAMEATKAVGRRRVAKALVEMAGDEGAAAARPMKALQPLAEAGGSLGGLPTVGVTLGRQSHKLLFGKIGERVGVVLCSECGLLIDKAAAMLNKLDHGHPLSGDLKALIKAANDAERWVGKGIRAGGNRAAKAQQELQKLTAILRDIEQRYPSALLQDVSSGIPSLGEPISSAKSPTAHGVIPPKPRVPEPAAPRHETSVIVDESLPHETRLSDDVPTLDIKPKSESALLQNAVGAARQRVADVLDEVGARRGAARGAEHLSPECMMGSCGLGRQSVARELTKAGVAESKVFMNQVADISGVGRHVFAVVETAPRRYILIDTTFAQFTGAIRGVPRVGEHILRQGGRLGKLLRKELLEKGYIVLSDEIANLYVKVVSETPRGLFQLSDLIRDEVSLARNPKLLDLL